MDLRYLNFNYSSIRLIQIRIFEYRQRISDISFIIKYTDVTIDLRNVLLIQTTLHLSILKRNYINIADKYVLYNINKIISEKVNREKIHTNTNHHTFTNNIK